MTPPTRPGAAAERAHDAEWRMEQLLGRMLQVGVLAAALLVIAGGFLLLSQSGGSVADFRTFVGVPDTLRSVPAIFRAALTLEGHALVQLGVIALIATPVARVALTLVAFIIQRDRIYVVLTSVVLAVLLYGLVWGKV